MIKTSTLVVTSLIVITNDDEYWLTQYVCVGIVIATYVCAFFFIFSIIVACLMGLIGQILFSIGIVPFIIGLAIFWLIVEKTLKVKQNCKWKHQIEKMKNKHLTSGKLESECTICLMETKGKKIIKSCHTFHLECLLRWLEINPQCPVCWQSFL